MSLEELERFWDYWIGSRFLQPETMKHQVNFLGSIKEHKRSFLEALKELIENNHLNERKIQMVEEVKTEGAFISSLKRTNKDIRSDRAEAIGEEAQLKSKRQVEDIAVILKQLKRDQENMLDMSPSNAMSLDLAKNFDSDAFVKERLSLARKIRLTEIDLKLATEDHKHLFGEEI